MFRKALRSISRVRYDYPDPVSQQRARVLIAVSISLILSGVAWAAVGALFSGLLSEELRSAFTRPEILFIPLFALFVYGLIQRGNLVIATWAFVLSLMPAPINVVVDGIVGTQAIFMLLPLVAAGALLPRNGIIVVMFTLLAFTGVGYYIQTGETAPLTQIPSERALLDLFLVALAVLVSGSFIIAFNVQAMRSLYSVQTTLQHYASIARLSAETNAPNISEDDAISRALIQAVEGMGISYAQMFIADASGSLKRRVRTAFGQNLTTRVDEEVSLGDTNIVYQAARNRITMKANMESPEMRRRHFLATTRASVAVPVMLGRELIGVLDFQTESILNFSDMQIATLEILADVVATAIESQRGRRAMELALKQAQEASQNRSGQNNAARSTSKADYWETLFQPAGESAIGFDLDAMRRSFVEAKDLAPMLRETLSKGKPHIDERPDGSVVSVPIMLNQQILGAMSFQLPQGRSLSKRQMELVETISARLALALENRRLFEQSRAQAERERKANDVARVLLSATEVDMVLRIAADNFNSALGAINTEIHVQSAPQTSIEQSEEIVS